MPSSRNPFLMGKRDEMYTPGRGSGPVVTPLISTTAGIAVLPNTGGNHLLFAASLLSTIVGSAILLSTLVRFLMKKYYKI